MDLETTIFVLDAQVCIPLSPVFSKDEGEGHQFTDEPTGNLDTKTTAQIMEMVLAFARENQQTIVLVTHDPEMASYADRILTLIDGNIVKDERKDKK